MAPELLSPLAGHLWPAAAVALAGLAALCAWLALDTLWTALARAGARPRTRVARYAAGARPDAAQRIGERLAGSGLFGQGPARRLGRWCQWANLDKAEPRDHANPAQVLGRCLLFGVPVACLGLPLQAWWMAPVGLVAALLPLVRVRETGAANVRRLRRSLPELLALMAGEVEVGTSLAQALAHAAGWGVPAAPLIEAAIAAAAAGDTPLFSRLGDGGAGRPGTLLQGADAFGDRDWRNLVQTLDAANQQGGGQASMQELASHLSTRTKQELMEASEKLEDRLLLPLIICFFPVMLSVSVLPMAMPLLDLFKIGP